jgi:hypothetical protein
LLLGRQRRQPASGPPFNLVEGLAQGWSIPAYGHDNIGEDLWVGCAWNVERPALRDHVIDNTEQRLLLVGRKCIGCGHCGKDCHGGSIKQFVDARLDLVGDVKGNRLDRRGWIDTARGHEDASINDEEVLDVMAAPPFVHH